MITQALQDELWMKRALELARKAASMDEVPVGAVVVAADMSIGEGTNCVEKSASVLGHAELVAMEQASKNRGSHRLIDATLYVTLEPCLMCLGAIVHTRISRVVFGAYEPKTGAFVSRYQLAYFTNHAFCWRGGVLAEQSSQLLRDFFVSKRHKYDCGS